MITWIIFVKCMLLLLYYIFWLFMYIKTIPLFSQLVFPFALIENLIAESSQIWLGIFPFLFWFICRIITSEQLFRKPTLLEIRKSKVRNIFVTDFLLCMPLYLFWAKLCVSEFFQPKNNTMSSMPHLTYTFCKFNVRICMCRTCITGDSSIWCV